MIQTNDTTSARVLRVACYERVSTDEQARHGISIDAQTAALESWVRDHGHVLIGHYTDAGISGGAAIDKRPAMVRLLRQVQAGQVDLILFTKLDRWFRSLKNYYKCQEILDAAHCAWQAIQEDYETLTASGRFKVNIMLSVAENERERTSERIQSVFDYKMAKGEFATGGRAVPYGYKLEGKHLVIDPETEGELRNLFDLVLSGVPANTAIHQVQAASPHPLRYMSYKRIICKPIYAGIHNAISGYCPAYITEDQHAVLLGTKGTRTPIRGNVFIFAGMIKCPVCGFAMVCRRTMGTDRYNYYRCGRHADHVCQYKKGLREDRIEEALTAFIFEAVDLSAGEIRPESAPSERPETAAQIEAKLRRLAETYTDGLIDRDTYKRKLTDLTEQLETVRNASRTRSDVPPSVIREIIDRDIKATYGALDRQEKRRFWMHVLQYVIFEDDYRIKEIEFF